MADIIVTSSDSLSGNIQDSDLLVLIRSGSSILSQPYDQFAIQLRGGLATQGALTGHAGDPTAHQALTDLADIGLEISGTTLTILRDGTGGNSVQVPTSGGGASDGVIDTLALTLNGTNQIVATAGRSIGGDVVSSGLALTAAAIPNLPAGKVNSGTFADGRIPATITRDTELATAVANVGLQISGTTLTILRDGTGGNSVQVPTSGGGGPDGVVEGASMTLHATTNVLNLALSRTVGGEVNANVDLSSLAGGGGASDGVIDTLALTLNGTNQLVATAGRTIGGDVVSSGLALTAAAIPNLPAGKVTSGTFADGLIPSAITRDTELDTAVGNLGLAIDSSGNILFKRDDSGGDSIHLTSTGGAYAYIDQSVDFNTPFTSQPGQVTRGGADNQPLGGWFMALRSKTSQTRGQIPTQPTDDWIRIDSELLVNVSGTPTHRLANIVRRDRQGNVEIYGNEPLATDAQSIDDIGTTSGNYYSYTPEQLAGVVDAHQSPVYDLPRPATIPTLFQGDLILLDHDYTEGGRQDASVTFGTGGAFTGWSDGGVPSFGVVGVTSKSLRPLLYIRTQGANNQVYRIASSNQTWLNSLDKYVHNNVEYDLTAHSTSLSGYYIRSVLVGPEVTDLATSFDFNLKFNSGAYFLTAADILTHRRGEYLWDPDATPAAYELYEPWPGMVFIDHDGDVIDNDIMSLELANSFTYSQTASDPTKLTVGVRDGYVNGLITAALAGYTPGGGGGVTILSGSGDPDQTLGENGNWYLNRDEGSWHEKAFNIWVQRFDGVDPWVHKGTSTKMPSSRIDFLRYDTEAALIAALTPDSQMRWFPEP